MFIEKKKTGALLLAAFFLKCFAMGLSFPLFSFFLFDRDLSFLPSETSDTVRGVWLGLVFALVSLCQFISAPIAGTLSDKKGRRSILLFLLALNLFGTVIASTAALEESLLLLLLSRLFLGISGGSFTLMYLSIADISDKATVPKNFGLLNAIKSFGYALGAFLSAWTSKIPLGAIGPLAKPLIFAALCMAVSYGLLYFFLEETFPVKKVLSTTLKNTLQDLKIGLTLPKMQLALLTVLIFCFGWSFYFEFFPVTLIKVLSADRFLVGNLSAIITASNALCSAFLIRPVFNHFRNSTILKWSMPLLSLSLTFLFFELKLSLLWIVIPIQQFLVALIYISLVTYIWSLARTDNKGQFLGTYQSVKSISFSLSPFAGALLGISPNMPILLPLCFVAFAAAILWRLLRKNQQIRT